jgi:Golgi phosphoprotein 3
MSGVTRRRGGAGGASEGTTTPVRSATPTNAKNGASSAGRAAVLDTQRESDHKIAYDPKDMEQGEERKKQPKLTLMEEVLLLGLKDREVGLTEHDRIEGLT